MICDARARTHKLQQFAQTKQQVPIMNRWGGDECVPYILFNLSSHFSVHYNCAFILISFFFVFMNFSVWNKFSSYLRGFCPLYWDRMIACRSINILCVFVSFPFPITSQYHLLFFSKQNNYIFQISKHIIQYNNNFDLLTNVNGKNKMILHTDSRTHVEVITTHRERWIAIFNRGRDQLANGKWILMYQKMIMKMLIGR